MAFARTGDGRQDTLASTTTDLNDADLGGTDPDSTPGLLPSLLDKEGLSRILIDAVQYNDAIEEEDVVDDEDSTEDDDDIGSIAERESTRAQKLVDLVGRNLSTQELAATQRFAKIHVMEKGDNLVSSSPTGLVASDEEGRSSEEGYENEASLRPLKADSPPDVGFFPPRSASVSQLTPPEIVKFLIDEFGPLTAQDDPEDTEELLMEVDGAYLQEIAILGGHAR
jgi:hypothetical protein